MRSQQLNLGLMHIASTCQYNVTTHNATTGFRSLLLLFWEAYKNMRSFKWYGWDQKSYQCSKNNDMIACVLQQLCFNAEVCCFHCYVKRLLKVHPKAIFLMTLIMKFNLISFFSKLLHQLRPKVGIAKPTKMAKKQRTRCDWHEHLVEQQLFFPNRVWAKNLFVHWPNRTGNHTK